MLEILEGRIKHYEEAIKKAMEQLHFLNGAKAETEALKADVIKADELKAEALKSQEAPEPAVIEVEKEVVQPEAEEAQVS